LGPAARAEWVRVLEVVKLHPRWLQRADYQTLAGWCAAVALFQEATADVVARGHLVAGRSSADAVRPDGARVVKNPSVSVAMAAASAMRSFGQQLGFSPSSRVSIPVGALEDDRDDLFDLGTWS
jgi:P27 family predicted phage terminase small subunit